MDRNIVLVTIDSLRADRCGFTGHASDMTPTLNRMAEEGVSFTTAIAPGPKTPESMPAIFTGLFPAGGTQGSNLDDWQQRIQPHMRAHQTIPDRLSRLGYETGGFTPNGFTSEYFGFDAGFDRFEDFLDDEYRPGFEIPNFLRGMIKWVRNEGNWKRWEHYYDEVLNWARQASEPFFLWVFLLDVHSPYLVPAEYRMSNSWVDMVHANWSSSAAAESEDLSVRLRSAYDDTVRYADAFLDRLERDLSDKQPVYIVHADHGEAFGEHGHYGHERHLFDENLHVPLVITNVAESVTIDQPVSLRSIPNMVAEVRDGSLDQQTLSQLQRTGPVLARSPEGNRMAARTKRFKYIRHPNTAVLYDLVADTGEQEDVSDKYPNVHAIFEAYVDTHVVIDNEQEAIHDIAGHARL